MPPATPKLDLPAAASFVLTLLGPILAREVNVGALVSVVEAYEESHLLENPVPAIVAHAATIFPDPHMRSFIVAILSKHLMSLAPTATAP